MKLRASLLFFSAVLSFAVPALVRADELLLTFTGFDYEDPNPNTTTFLDVGEGYKALGFVTTSGPLLQPYMNFATNEYTFFFYDLTVASRAVQGNLFGASMSNGGRGRFYSDDLAPPNGTGTHGDYGTSPPNPTAPSTFTDGTVALGGTVDNFSLTYNFNTNQGNFQANMTLDEGPYLAYIPVAQRSGWVLSGLTGRPNPSVPGGYVDQISGECRIPDVTTTIHGTWGAVKALYH